MSFASFTRQELVSKLQENYGVYMLKKKKLILKNSYKTHNLVFQASRACRIETQGGRVIQSTECRSRGNQTVSCNSTSACDVPYQRNEVKLYFCERPERPQGGNRQFGGNRRPFGGNRQNGADRQDDDNSEENGEDGENRPIRR